LRTLNLRSPSPFNNRPAPYPLSSELSPNSPDFSPASVSSALLTPTDLSPARPFDLKLPSPYESDSAHIPYVSSAFLLENASPTKHQRDTMLPTFAPFRPPLVHLNHARHQPSATSQPYLDAYSDSNTPIQGNAHIHTPTLPDLPQSIYSSSRRSDLGRLASMDWRLNHPMASSQPAQEWRLSEKPSLHDFGFNINQEDAARPSFVYQQAPASQAQPTHEVIVLALDDCD